MSIAVRLLGQFALEAGDPPTPISVAARKGRALIAYLAMAPEYRASRGQLATLLWGDRLDSEARHNLRQCLHGLRKDLSRRAPDLILVRPDEVGLGRRDLWVDAREFTTLAASGEPGDLNRAIDTYQGPFLPDFFLDLETFDAWAEQERARLAGLASRTFTEFIKRAEHGEAAIGAAERLVALDPLSEESQRLLLRGTARFRGPAEALARAKAVAALLRRELDVDPEPETQALIAEIAQDAGRPSSTAGRRSRPSRTVEPAPHAPALADAGRASGSAERSPAGPPSNRISSGSFRWAPAAAPAACALLLLLTFSGPLNMVPDEVVAFAPVIRRGSGAAAADAAKTATSVVQQPRVQRRETGRDEEVLLDRHTALDRRCRRQGYPIITMLRPPTHGSISLRHEYQIVASRYGYRETCKGLSRMGTAIYYTPEWGFAGEDQVTYRIFWPIENRERTDTMIILVGSGVPQVTSMHSRESGASTH